MELLLTLGHNCSAILMDDGQLVAGYEEERFTRNKKTSSFPINSIKELFKLKEPDPESEKNILYISHWFDDFEFYKNRNEKVAKYYDYDYVDEVLIEKYGFKIKTLNGEFTHHDAHAYSSLAFYDNFEDIWKYDGHVIVADGFGNKEEVFSIYAVENNKPRLINRAYGYGNSLGLMYQYATAFCGMKENQDEYKFLGYEAEIGKLNSLPDFAEIVRIVNTFVAVYTDNKTSSSSNTDFINLDRLQMTREFWYGTFTKVLRELGYEEKEDEDNFTKRVIIGYFIQKIIELVNINIIQKYQIKKVLLSGGIYYNVKLNMAISRNVEKISVIPVTGDQGCAIGLYYKNHGHFDFGDLCFGKRTLNNMHPKKHFLKGIEYFVNRRSLVERATELLKDDKIVEVVFGDMEFGPRALCHTSTLAKPTKKNANFINKSNHRNEIMPMAPIVLEENATKLFYKEQLDKIVGSDGYMIITLDYKENVDYSQHSGVMHKYPGMAELYSGRPQIIKDKSSTIYHILKGIDDLALINTSYNIHGKPIVRSLDDAVDDFKFQLEHTNDEDRIHLLIGLYDE